MDEHFADLFARYQELGPERILQPVRAFAGAAAPQMEPLPEVALARTRLRLS